MRGNARWRLACSFALATATAPMLAQANALRRAHAPAEDAPLEPPVALELEWTAPDGCPTADDVRTAIAALLARRVDLEPTASVLARGQIERSGAGYRLQLGVDTEGGAESRELVADRCDVLTQAAALIIATGIDPARVAARVHAERTAPATTPPPAIPAARTESTRVPARANPPPPADRSPRRGLQLQPRGSVTVASGPAVGFVPSVAAWLGGDVALHLNRARIGATVGHTFARRSGNRDEIGATVQLTSGGLMGCFAPSWRKVALAACGLAELGLMRAEGRGPGVDTARQRALWVGLGLRTGVEYSPLQWLALVAQVDVLAAARRPGFHVLVGDTLQQVFRAAPAALRVALGLSFRFP